MGGYAWVTLATNNSYSLGALVLAHSLKKSNSPHKLAVLITPAVSEPMREQLRSVFDVVKMVDVLDSKDEAHLALMQRPDLGITFTKIHCWRLTEFDKCVFLDADTLVVRNCDELFEREEFSAAPDVSWPDCFNSGVFVYKPSVETFNKLLQFAVENRSFDGGDQGLLNQFFSDWATEDIKKHLPFVYNLTSVAAYSYIPAFKHYGSETRIVHFIGAGKPWLQQLDAGTRTVTPISGSEHLAPLLQQWWDLFCEKVHPNLDKNLESNNDGISHPPVEACSNFLPIALTDEPLMPRLIEPCTPYREKDDFRQHNLPYQPFDVRGLSGELLNVEFLLASVAPLPEPHEQKQEENKMEEKEQPSELEEIREREPSNDDSTNGEDVQKKKETQEPEKPAEDKQRDDQNEGNQQQEQQEQEQHEEPPPPKDPFDYHSFFPDETCISNYLEQNVVTYQPLDSNHQEVSNNSNNLEIIQQIPPPLPRFLTIPENDRRQSGNTEPQLQEEHQKQCDLPPKKEPILPIEPTPPREEPPPEKRELTKSKSMPYLHCDVTKTEPPPQPQSTRSIWKSQPDVNVELNRKFSMPKLKPILPKQNSFVKTVPSAIPKVTLYTEFLMSSEYKDPVDLPKDKEGFVKTHIHKEATLRRSKSDADISSKFGPLPYTLTPEIEKPVVQKTVPFRHLDNEFYDLAQCKRQMGNKPKPKDAARRKENVRPLPALKPITPAKDQNSTLIKKRKSKELSPQDGGREKIAKREPQIVRERKRGTTPRNLSTNGSDLDEILQRLKGFSKNYQHFFGDAVEPKRKTVKNAMVQANECKTSEEFESITTPVSCRSRETQTSNSQFRQFRNCIRNKREESQKGFLGIKDICSKDFGNEIDFKSESKSKEGWGEMKDQERNGAISRKKDTEKARLEDWKNGNDNLTESIIVEKKTISDGLALAEGINLQLNASMGGVSVGRKNNESVGRKTGQESEIIKSAKITDQQQNRDLTNTPSSGKEDEKITEQQQKEKSPADSAFVAKENDETVEKKTREKSKRQTSAKIKDRQQQNGSEITGRENKSVVRKTHQNNETVKSAEITEQQQNGNFDLTRSIILGIKNSEREEKVNQLEKENDGSTSSNFDAKEGNETIDRKEQEGNGSITAGEKDETVKKKAEQESKNGEATKKADQQKDSSITDSLFVKKIDDETRDLQKNKKDLTENIVTVRESQQELKSPKSTDTTGQEQGRKNEVNCNLTAVKDGKETLESRGQQKGENSLAGGITSSRVYETVESKRQEDSKRATSGEKTNQQQGVHSGSTGSIIAQKEHDEFVRLASLERNESSTVGTRRDKTQQENETLRSTKITDQEQRKNDNLTDSLTEGKKDKNTDEKRVRQQNLTKDIVSRREVVEDEVQQKTVVSRLSDLTDQQQTERVRTNGIIPVRSIAVGGGENEGTANGKPREESQRFLLQSSSNKSQTPPADSTSPMEFVKTNRGLRSAEDTIGTSSLQQKLAADGAETTPHSKLIPREETQCKKQQEQQEKHSDITLEISDVTRAPNGTSKKSNGFKLETEARTHENATKAESSVADELAVWDTKTGAVVPSRRQRNGHISLERTNIGKKKKKPEKTLCVPDFDTPRTSRVSSPAAKTAASDLIEEITTDHRVASRKPRSTAEKDFGNGGNDSPDETVMAVGKKTPVSLSSPAKTSTPCRGTEHPEDWRNTSGIAGAIAQLNLEAGSEQTPESSAALTAHQEYLRRQNWETGNMDYMGKDSFDNIWSKICQTLEGKETEEPTKISEQQTEDKENPVSLSANLQKCPEHTESLPDKPAIGSDKDDEKIFSKMENKQPPCLTNIAEEGESLAIGGNLKLSDILLPAVTTPDKGGNGKPSEGLVAESFATSAEKTQPSADTSEAKSQQTAVTPEIKPQSSLAFTEVEPQPVLITTDGKSQLSSATSELKSQPSSLQEEAKKPSTEEQSVEVKPQSECTTVAIHHPLPSSHLPPASEQKPKISTEVAEKPKCTTVAIPCPPMVIPVAPSTDQGKPEISSEPIPLPPPDLASTQQPAAKPPRSDFPKDEGKQRKGVFTKILEMVGVAPKEKDGTETKSVFYDDLAREEIDEQAQEVKPSGDVGQAEDSGKVPEKKAKPERSSSQKQSLKASGDKRKSPSPLTIPQTPQTSITTPTPPPQPDVPPRKNSGLLKVEELILETPPVEAVREKVSSEIEELLGKAKSEVESRLQDSEETTDLINTMKLMVGSEQPPEDIEELRVTTEEERKQHKGEAVSSKLSDQILKAIPPPRRKAISEASASTSAIPKAPEQKTSSGEGKGKHSKPSSIPVPPPRSRGKPTQPPPPKGKGKK